MNFTHFLTFAAKRLCLGVLLSGFLAAAVLTAAPESDADAVSTENIEMATLLGELLALAPRLNDLSLTDSEVETLLDGLIEGFELDEIPPEISDRYDEARDAMQIQFIAQNRGQDVPEIGESLTRIIGIMTAEFAGVAGFAFTMDEQIAIRSAFRSALESPAMSLSLRAGMNDLLDYLDAKAATYEIALGEKVDRRERPYFENLRAEYENIEFDEQGLHWLVIDPGVGDPPGPTDRVRVHYEGKRIDGETFDSSLQRGEPATFSMSGVIPGFAGGLKKIGRGGKVMIYIPAQLGYGANPPPGSSIQPGDTLIFDAEIIDIIRDDS